MIFHRPLKSAVTDKHIFLRAEMHIVLQAIQILLFKKGYVEVQYDRGHNNDDSINQDGMFCMYRREITLELITEQTT